MTRKVRQRVILFDWIVIPCSNVARHGEVEVKERHETKKRKAEESVSVAVRALV